MCSLKDAVCVVTGGSDGYGEGIARALCARGAKVFITARSGAKLSAVAASCGAVPIVADVTRPEDWDRVFAQIGGRIDVLVNNAGAAVRICEQSEATDEELAASVAVNLTQAMFGCARAARLMKAQRSGTIVNISSVCDRHAWPGFGAYSAAKAGLRQYSRVLFTELRPFNVRVTLLCPSWGRTNFSRASGREGLPEATLARAIQPKEIGDVVVGLCELPAHLCQDEVVLRPLVQEIIPM